MTPQLIEDYLEAHKHSWAPTTLKTERSRLLSIIRLNTAGLPPAGLFDAMAAAGWKPYTVKISFIRLASLEKWSQTDLGYDRFLKEMRNRFKHSYERKDVELTYDEAVSRINQIPCLKARHMAIDMLRSGVRISEAYNIKDGAVRGKGDKLRKVFVPVEASVPRSTLWARLKEVGLKPHDLRKLCATRLASQGASAADLCKVFGWSSIATAYLYLQPKDDKKLQEMMNANL